MTQPTKHAELLLDRFLPYRLSVLSNRISQDIAALYSKRFNLGITEWRVMAVLGAQSPLSAVTVAERTAMDKVAVSRAVAGLLAKGFLKRQTDASDRRRLALTLSAAGYAVFDEVVPLALDIEGRILSVLPESEQRHLLAILDKLEVAELALKD